MPTSSAVAWVDKKQFDKAIADYTEAIRLDPRGASAYAGRADAWRCARDYDKAIADYTEAIRLDPKDARIYRWRGVAWREKKEHGKAISDFDEAIRLDPKDPYAPYHRAVVLFLSRGIGAVDGAKATLDLAGWRGELSIYAVLLGHFAARRNGFTEQAREYLDDAKDRCDTLAWPYAIIRYLRGEIDEPKLLAAATDNDRMTEVRCYLGLDVLEKGQKEAAVAHFRWVKEHGNRAHTLYAIALAELELLEGK